MTKFIKTDIQQKTQPPFNELMENCAIFYHSEVI